MGEQGLGVYMGKVLRVNLTRGMTKEDPLERDLVENYVGGTGLGAEYLYREVPPGISWDDPENRIIMASGPLGGTTVSGTGTFSLVTKRPMTNLAVSTSSWGSIPLLGSSYLSLSEKKKVHSSFFPEGSRFRPSPFPGRQAANSGLIGLFGSNLEGFLYKNKSLFQNQEEGLLKAFQGTSD
jgi:hypothetical protein